MSPRIKELGIDRLSADERIELLQEICDSLESDFPEEPLSDEQKSKIDSRLANYQSDPGATTSWEQVEAEALDRIRK